MQGRQEGKVKSVETRADAAGAPQFKGHPLLLDTHVLLDLWLFDDPRLQPLALRLKDVRWVATAAMVAEWHYMMQRGIDRFPPRSVVDLPQPELLPAPSQAAPWRCRDPDDQMFLDLAFALKPCALWTRDKALLAHRKRATAVGVLIETPEIGLARCEWA